MPFVTLFIVSSFTSVNGYILFHLVCVLIFVLTYTVGKRRNLKFFSAPRGVVDTLVFLVVLELLIKYFALNNQIREYIAAYLLIEFAFMILVKFAMDLAETYRHFFKESFGDIIFVLISLFFILSEILVRNLSIIFDFDRFLTLILFSMFVLFGLLISFMLLGSRVPLISALIFITIIALKRSSTLLSPVAIISLLLASMIRFQLITSFPEKKYSLGLNQKLYWGCMMFLLLVIIN